VAHETPEQPNKVGQGVRSLIKTSDCPLISYDVLLLHDI
jgi:hypothetical protein